MTAAGSFRRRLIVGSLLWIFGLLAFTTVLGVALIHRYPHLVMFVHNSALVVFATVCLLGGLSMVRHGLSPFNALRERLAAVRKGQDRRVEGHYPSEVQPLVDDLNALLEHRDLTVKRAIAKAGDLAHALKTPLAVLAHEAEVADGAGQGELAAVMRQQVERMRRQVDYHLAHARAAASGAAPIVPCERRPRGWRGRCCGYTPGAASPFRSTSPLRTPSGPSGKISTRCSAISSTTPASGADRRSRLRPTPKARL
jgi:signal transduction histidine kinase